MTVQAPSTAHPAAEPTEITRRVDIGRGALAITCSGSGPITVLLETGLGAESAEWGKVQADLARVARVCRYDRANRGMSDAAPKPRTASQMLDDLDLLLARAGVSGPFIAVGQSFGGLLMRLFAQRHQSEARGLVLVDSMHADQFDVFGPDFPPYTPGEPPALAGMRAFWTTGWRNPESTVEGIDMPASIILDREVTSLGDLPMRVINADSFLHDAAAPGALQPVLQQRWNGLQQRFLGLSSRATLVHAHGSGHFVQRDNPALVAEVIRDLLPN